MNLEDELKKLEDDPGNLEVLCTAGKIYKQQNDFDTARSYFLKALEFDPDYCPATCCLVNLLIDSGQYSEGFATFNEALEAHQSDEKYKATLFNALFAMFLLHKIAAETNLASANHNYEELFFRIGSAYKNNKLYEPAIKIFEETYNLSTSNARLILDLAECYLCIDEIYRAEQLLLDLEDKYPGDKDIMVLLADVYLKLENYTIAGEYAKKVLNILPHYEKMQNLLAVTYIKNKEFLKAIDVFKGQVNSGENKLRAYKNLFIVYKLIGNNMEAEKIFVYFKQTDKELAEYIELELEEYAGNLETLIDL